MEMEIKGAFLLRFVVVERNGTREEVHGDGVLYLHFLLVNQSPKRCYTFFYPGVLNKM